MKSFFHHHVTPSETIQPQPRADIFFRIFSKHHHDRDPHCRSSRQQRSGALSSQRPTLPAASAVANGLRNAPPNHHAPFFFPSVFAPFLNFSTYQSLCLRLSRHLAPSPALFPTARLSACFQTPRQSSAAHFLCPSLPCPSQTTSRLSYTSGGNRSRGGLVSSFGRECRKNGGGRRTNVPRGRRRQLRQSRRSGQVPDRSLCRVHAPPPPPPAGGHPGSTATRRHAACMPASTS